MTNRMRSTRDCLCIFANAVLSIACLIGLPRRAYGQNAVFSNMPVKPGSLLRANRDFFKSARKCTESNPSAHILRHLLCIFQSESSTLHFVITPNQKSQDTRS